MELILSRPERYLVKVRQKKFFHFILYFYLFILVWEILEIISIKIFPIVTFYERDWEQTIISFIIGALTFGPFLETLIFQCLVIGLLLRVVNYKAAIIISALIFGGVHFNTLNHIIFAFGTGIILGTAYTVYRNHVWKAIWAVTILHSLTNLTLIALAGIGEFLFPNFFGF